MKKFLYKILKRAARNYLRRQKPYIIGITGSVGKTTCRMIVAQVLQQQLPHLRISTSPKNFNTEIGLVLSILEITSWSTYPLRVIRTVILSLSKSIFAAKKYDVLVLEYGIDHPGDMDYLLSIAKPHVGVFTGIDKVHVAYFEDLDELLEEKMKMLLATKELVLTPESAGYTRTTLEQIEVDQLTYSLRDDQHADIYFTNHTLEKNKNTVLSCFNLMQETEVIGTVESNLLGQHEAGYISIGVELGMILERRLENKNTPLTSPLLKEEGSSVATKYYFMFQQQAGRFSIFEGKFGSMLVDSTYNAGPKSMQVTIENTIGLRRKVYHDFDLIYCLGDMRELGMFSEEEHRNLAAIVAQSADAVYLIGEWMTSVMKDELEKLGYNTKHIYVFDDSIELGKKVLHDIEKRERRSLILCKGSQNTIFLEEAVKILLRNKEDKKLLCRQGKFWEKRK